MMARALKAQNRTQDSRVVWGKFLLALREQKELSLHMMCVELSDYHIEDKTFVVYVTKKINFDTLRKLSNMKKLNDIFRSLGLGLELTFRYQECPDDDKVAKSQKL